MRKKFFYTALLLLYIALIIMLAALPSVTHLDFVTDNDKLMHFLEFFVLAILLARTSSFYFEKNYGYPITIISGFVAAYASELVQLFVRVRSFSYRDLAADFFGIIIGTTIVATLRYFRDSSWERQAT